MTYALFWLTASILFTSLLWILYVVDRMAVRGIPATLGYDESKPGSEWAVRARRAHANAAENLVVFAPLILVHHLATAGAESAGVGLAALIYFVARVVHFVAMTAKVPVVRTLGYVTGWAACVYVAVVVLSL